MTKLLFVTVILVLGIYLVRMAFNLGKAKGKEKEIAPDLDTLTEINDRIKAIMSEITLLENSMPAEIEKHKEKLTNMQSELERLQKIKVKFQ